MSQGFLNALVTFRRTSDRRRAETAIQNWVTNYNSTHPNAVFVGSVTETTAFDEDNGGTFPALQVSYICSNYSGVEDAQVAIAQDLNANAYLTILNLSTWQTP